MNRSRIAVPLRVEALEIRENLNFTVPSGFQVVPVVTEGLDFVTVVTIGPDGRILLSEKDGDLRMLKNDQLVAEPVVSLNVNSEFERGLLGTAFDPNFAVNGYVYIFYSSGETVGENRVSRFIMQGDKIDPTTETILLRIDAPAVAHNSGMLHFGPDGKLYISVGDNPNPADAQSINTLNGKILRINPDGSIPTDNPFYNQTTGAARAIWAYGLRNPFSFAFQPGTGLMYINDVGQNKWEELNQGVAGGNFGWPLQEGPDGDTPEFIDALMYYGHPEDKSARIDGVGTSITGGAFYNPISPSYPSEYYGKYFYNDFTAAWIRTYDPATKQTASFLQGDSDGMLGLAVNDKGEMYFSTFYHSKGQSIHKITYTAPGQAPSIAQDPLDRTASIGGSTQFVAVATGSGTLTYQWQKNGENIPGAVGPELSVTNVTLADQGAKFRVVVTNEYGTITSEEATLNVLNNNVPTPTIITPTINDLFGLGRTFTFSGAAIDPEDGDLPASAFSWEAYVLTGKVERLYFSQTGVREGSFFLPDNSPYDRTDVQLRFDLTVTDSQGGKNKTSVSLQPELTPVTVQSNVAGTTTLGGQPFQGTVDGVVGFRRELGAVTETVVDGKRYRFVGWSDGGTPVKDVVFAAGGNSYFANYRRVDPIVIGHGAGGLPQVTIQQVDTDETTVIDAFEPNFTGGVRVATGDVNRDGVADIIMATGAGGGPRIRIVDGATQADITSFFAFEESFTGGVNVATADVNGDGVDDLILSAGEGGSARVRILNGADTTQVFADFFAIEDENFRGGSYVSLNDVNNDGTPDLIVGAGLGGGPRVAIFNGITLMGSPAGTTPPKLVSDFFAFESSVNTGVVPAVGDVNGDGFADLAFAVPEDGAPRIFIIDGRQLVEQAGSLITIVDFYAGEVDDRQGAHIAFKDVDGDALMDLLVSSANPLSPLSVYSGTQLTNGDTAAPSEQLTGLANVNDGVFVG